MHLPTEVLRQGNMPTWIRNSSSSGVLTGYRTLWLSPLPSDKEDDQRTLHRFEEVAELKQAFEAVLSSKSPEFFREAFFEWRYRAEKCVEHKSDYIEK